MGKEILKNKTVPELIENWQKIIFERNRKTLNDVPLSCDEMDRVMDVVKLQANTPVKANHFINGRPIAIKRDMDSPDTQHAGHEVYLDLFAAAEIAGGSSRYQIAEQTYFSTDPQYNDRRGDITLLINGMPVIHMELKASGIDVSEATNQITKYTNEGVFTVFMGLVQVFWAMTPEDAVFFANAGAASAFNSAFFFRWGDQDNNIVKDWKGLITGEYHILSIPGAHKLIGYYTVADTANAGKAVLDQFVSDFNNLKKYSDPLSDLSSRIEETNASLKESLKDLTGSDTDMEAVMMLMEEL